MTRGVGRGVGVAGALGAALAITLLDGAAAAGGAGAGIVLVAAAAPKPRHVAIAVLAAGGAGLVLFLQAGLALGLALTVWGATAWAVSRHAGRLGAVFLLSWLAVEVCARLTSGMVGELADLVSPVRALHRALQGAVDGRDLLLLAAPGLTALGWGGSGVNDRARRVLVPVVAALGFVALRPIPVLLDLSRDARFSLDAAQREVASRNQVPTLWTFERGPAMTHSAREAVRIALDAMPALNAASGTVASVRVLRSGSGGASVRALDAVHRLALDDPTTAVVTLMGAVDRIVSGPPPSVGWWGAPPPAAADLGHRVVQSDDLGDAGVVVASPDRPLTRDEHVLLDQGAMAATPLLLLLGPADDEGPPGAEFLRAWGMNPRGALSQDHPATSAGHPAVPVAPRSAPAGVLSLAGVDGLTWPLIHAGGEVVAHALLGSVDTSLPPDEPRAVRRRTDGAIRVIVLSRALLDAEPGMLGAMVDWLTDRPDGAATRRRLVPPPGPLRRGAALLLALLVPWGVLREAREEE